MSNELITPELLARLRRHALPLRRPAMGSHYGVHAGVQRGVGVAFNEYRLYAPGDDPKRVDWKVVARSDRYYVREAERDSTTPVWLLLDDSASMDECGTQGVSKRRWLAAFLAGTAAMAIRQGDAVGVALLSAQPSLRLPQRGQKQLSAISQLLREHSQDFSQRYPAKTPLELPFPNALPALTTRLRPAGLVLLASDFLDTAALRWLAILHAQGHDVVALCAATARERAFDLPASGWWQGREGEAPRVLDRARWQAAYVQAREAHFDAVQTFCRQHAVQWLEADPDSAVETAVLRFLAARVAGAGP